MKQSLLITALLLVATCIFVRYATQDRSGRLLPGGPTEVNAGGSAASYEALMAEFNRVASAYEDLSHVTLEGTAMYVHYRRTVSDVQFREDAANFAKQYSRRRKEMTGLSAVTVRCVYNGTIYAQAKAFRGELTEVQFWLHGHRFFNVHAL